MHLIGFIIRIGVQRNKAIAKPWQICQTSQACVSIQRHPVEWLRQIRPIRLHCLSSSSSSYVRHGVRPLVDPFRSHASRILFRGLPRFLLPIGEQCFIILGSLSRGILFTCCIQFLLYSSSLSRTGVISNSFAMCESAQVYPAVLLIYFFSAAVILLIWWNGLILCPEGIIQAYEFST